ncbi:urea ABC transporter ATP-binding subunit UrtE [soil metagenome]
MLAISNLSFAYGAVKTIRDVSMTMPTGQITCVMGRNGVGKTTLMKNIIGVLKADEGSILVDGKEVVTLPPHKRAKSGVAWVAQGRLIFPKITVEENLKVGLEARSDGKRTIPEEIYELFPILKQFTKRNGGDLSGGQQQQLAIGRALAGDPKVLLLDEPTEGIQPNIIQQIGEVLRMLATKRNMTIVLVEQYLDFVREFGQQFYIMNRGQVAYSGQTSELSQEVVAQHLSV